MKKEARRTSIMDPSERLFFLIENTKEYALIVLDAKGKVEDWNKGARQLLGYTQKEIVGKNFARFFTPEDRKAKKPEKEIRKVRTSGQANDKSLLVRKDGSQFWASGHTIAIKDEMENIVGFAKIIRDLSDRRELEQQKDDFISIASHELRTPLTSAGLYRQVLGKYLKQKKDQKGLEYMDKINHSMDKLDALIRGLLNVTKLQGGVEGYEKETFPITTVVKNVVSEVQGTTLSHQIIVRGTTTKKIFAYKPQIEEVLTNLITNAIKYSPNSKKIVITIKPSKESVTIQVRDYGMGIEKKSFPLLFERFYRTFTSKDKDIPGMGLGLYITKKIVELHKGNIGVRSIIGKGTMFFFKLPVVK